MSNVVIPPVKVWEKIFLSVDIFLSQYFYRRRDVVFLSFFTHWFWRMTIKFKCIDQNENELHKKELYNRMDPEMDMRVRN